MCGDVSFRLIDRHRRDGEAASRVPHPAAEARAATTGAAPRRAGGGATQQNSQSRDNLVV